MSFPIKVKTPIAVSNYSKQDLSSDHLTTANFMQFNIAKCIELVPKQRISIGMQTQAYLDPLPRPVRGIATIRNRAYFVPYRTVFPQWDDFITDVPHVADGEASQIPSVVTFDYATLNYLFSIGSDDTYLSNAGTSTVYDFVYRVYESDSSMTVTSTFYRKFTSLGRHIYKLLRSLGYALDFTNRSDYVSAIPLLCVAKVYLDFYYPAQYANDVDSVWVKSLLSYDSADLGDLSLSQDDLIRLFRFIQRVSYDSDYYTSAWDNANAPNAQLASDVSIPDVNDVRGDIDDPSVAAKYDSSINSNAPVLGEGSSSSLNNITQFALNSLRSLSDYMKRHQIAGSRNLDRYLARFGVQLPAANLNRAVYIGEKTEIMRFGDIYSTADTDGSQLGSYAGTGRGINSSSWDFQTEEFGMLIIISTIIPESAIYQGENRHVKHLSKLDFYTPEFDNLGTQAMACKEVFVPTDMDVPVGYKDKVFGFVPRYGEYKTGYSQLTGDFLVKTLNTGMDSWTLMRDLKPHVERIGLDNFVHNVAFVQSWDREQYDRIFYNTADNADKIVVQHLFAIESYFPGKSLFNTYEFENEDKADKVTFDVNGTTHN